MELIVLQCVLNFGHLVVRVHLLGLEKALAAVIREGALCVTGGIAGEQSTRVVKESDDATRRRGTLRTAQCSMGSLSPTAML